MSSATNHKVRPLTEAEINALIERGENYHKWCMEHIKGVIQTKEQCIHNERKCRISHKCQNESTYLLSYLYVTGNSGRISLAEKPICDEHAQAYLPQNEQFHTERIICPECGSNLIAKVFHTLPFYIYVHECEKCSYVIMESEWETVSESKPKDFVVQCNVCGQRYENWSGSTPCCGSIAYIVEDGVVTDKFSMYVNIVKDQEAHQ